jgi:Chalcone isomerase-like
MRVVRWLAVAALTLGGLVAGAAELVGVKGSSVRYPSVVEINAGKPIRLILTGTALRQKLVFNVYTIGSYVQEGSGVKTPEQLAAVDTIKCLHLIMERTVEGKDMAGAFETAIRKNHPSPAFDAEVAQLLQVIQSHSAEKGSHIVLTHVPGVGLHCSLRGKVEFVIKNPQFSRAVWDIYLGKHPVSDAIKKDLVSRL